MRWAELALFLSPFALFAVWWLAAKWARPDLVWPVVAAVAVLAVATIWFGLSRRLDRGQTYVPAAMVDGRVVAGHGVPAERR